MREFTCELFSYSFEVENDMMNEIANLPFSNIAACQIACSAPLAAIGAVYFPRQAAIKGCEENG